MFSILKLGHAHCSNPSVIALDDILREKQSVVLTCSNLLRTLTSHSTYGIWNLVILYTTTTIHFLSSFNPYFVYYKSPIALLTYSTHIKPHPLSTYHLTLPKENREEFVGDNKLSARKEQSSMVEQKCHCWENHPVVVLCKSRNRVWQNTQRGDAKSGREHCVSVGLWGLN